MGASDFRTKAKGATAREAFNAARVDAQYEHGHAGYTGTIAEKGTFKEITVPAGKDPEDYAEELMDNDDERPRLESRQLPPAWEVAEDGGYTHRLGGQVDLDTQLGDFAGLTIALLYGATRDEVRTMGRDLIALIDWLDHEDAVRAQDGGS